MKNKLRILKLLIFLNVLIIISFALVSYTWIEIYGIGFEFFLTLSLLIIVITFILFLIHLYKKEIKVENESNLKYSNSKFIKKKLV